MSFNSVHRNRVIYQSEALFISPDATGYHYTGAGGYGLATPPVSNADPGQGSFPGGRMHGWNPDENVVGGGQANWPAWNPAGPSWGECSELATLAGFNSGGIPVENILTMITLTADVAAAAGAAITLTQTAGPLGLVPAPLETISQLVTTWNTANPGNTVSFDPACAAMVLPANTVLNITDWVGVAGGGGAMGVDSVKLNVPSISTLVDSVGTPIAGFQFEALDGGIFPNNAGLAPVIINFNAGLAMDAVIAAHNAANPTQQINPGTIPTDIPANGSSISILNNVVTVIDGVNPPVVPAQTAGINAVQSRYQAPTLVTNLTTDVELTADVPGSAGNALLVGDGVSDLDTLVAAWNHAATGGKLGVGALPGEKISIVTTNFPAQGGKILDLGTSIQLIDGTDPQACNHGSVIQQLKRVQTVNYGFTVNRTDVNQFGHLSRLDSIVIEAPTVNLDFSYYLLDGYNERHLEFSTDGVTNCLSGALSPELYQAGNNFFLLTVPEARDAAKGDASLDKAGDGESKSVISIGNGFLTDYSVDLSVGSIPTVSCTIEGMNIQSELNQTGLNLPAVDMIDGSKISEAWDTSQGEKRSKDGSCTGLFSLPATKSGYTGCEDVAALRPSDIWIDVKGTSLLSKQISGDNTTAQLGTAHIQSASISVPMARSTLQRLGSTFGFSKALDVPVTTSLSISAILSELQEGNLMDMLCGCDETDITISIHDPECAACEMKTGAPAMRFIFRGARLDSENFSASIGDNKTVDLNFTVQAGGADDMAKGLYISGKESHDIRQGSISATNPNGVENGGVPPAWTGTNGRVNIPVDTSVPAEVQKLDARLGNVVGGFSNSPVVLGYRA